MRYIQSAKFKKAYGTLPDDIKEKARKAFQLFKENPRHPSLHTKKMEGGSEYFEGRIDIKYRFVFRYEEDAVVFLHIGTHDILDEF